MQNPDWLIKKTNAESMAETDSVLKSLCVDTICKNARCPNRCECYQNKTVTFLLMGNICSRNCRFCAVSKGTPKPVDPGEPDRVAEAAKRLDLLHTVITSVTRDDLADGGAEHFAKNHPGVKESTTKRYS